MEMTDTQNRSSNSAPAIPRWVSDVCRLIDEAEDGPPTLSELAAAVGKSPYHLQRQFKRALGMSPRDYAAQKRLERFKNEMRNGESVASALYGAGFGSTSRLYERAGETLGMTPASYGRGGAGAEIGYAVTDSPLGRMLVAATDHGVCRIGFGDRDDELVTDLREEYPAARIKADANGLKSRLDAVLSVLDGDDAAGAGLSLDVRATAFQWKVWDCLRRIPRGATLTYGEIAEAIGAPRAARAVGRACATNPVAVAVPCHRAVGADGSLTGYRWGVARKKQILDMETGATRRDR